MVQILSGKIVSRKVYSDLTPRIDSLKKQGIIPGLAVILVGENPASKIYVKSKTRKFESLGLYSKTIHLKDSIDESELISYSHLREVSIGSYRVLIGGKITGIDESTSGELFADIEHTETGKKSGIQLDEANIESIVTKLPSTGFG